jgi:8-oxo-dGTP pyrophosphatase MutT (NUDIX family)
MAFPGGKRDPIDTTLLETARRETLEELGIDLNATAELLGVLPRQSLDRGAAGQLDVQPFVFAFAAEPTLTPNHEVEKIVWLPVGEVETGARDTSIVHEHRGSRLSFPAWELNGHKVWGLTYRMIQSLLELLKAGRGP